MLTQPLWWLKPVVAQASSEGEVRMKIELPIDTSAVSFIDVMPPEPVLDHKTKQQRSDASGEPLYSIELCCIGGKGGEVLTVKFAGAPPAGIRVGMPVKVTGLMVTDWA